jgi:hypothetical protein
MFKKSIEYKLFFTDPLRKYGHFKEESEEKYRYIQAIPHVGYIEFIVFQQKTPEVFDIPAMYQEIFKKSYRYSGQVPNGIAFIAINGIALGDVQGETAEQIIWGFLYEQEIVPMNENSWLNEYFPTSWLYYTEYIKMDREREAMEVVDA